MPAPSDSSRFVIGVDLGGTNIVVAAMSLDGSRLLGEASAPTLAPEGAESVVARMAEMVNTCIGVVEREAGVSRDAVLGIGLGILAATRQYSWVDTGLGILSFLGMTIPRFLLAIIIL